VKVVLVVLYEIIKMKIKVETWSIQKLYKLKDKINPKPQYQRTSVWQPHKKKLLIDSILRGYDLPKFYLRETPSDVIYDYEVTDGQQRMRAICEFIENEYKLNESKIGSLATKALDFENLKKNHKVEYDAFIKFELGFAVIQEATQEEIRTLFARLQMGERLNPVELRHALASNIGNAICSIVENHKFFDKNCKISSHRYKHQDYLDNAITLSYYDANKNIKAVDMKTLYVEFSNSTLPEMQPLLLKVNKVLDMIFDINRIRKGIFKNKWAFVDVFYLIFKNFERLDSLNPDSFANNFLAFESKRKQFNRNPEILIDDKTSLQYDKDLYDYIIAFKTSGADKQNAKIRYRVIYNKFFNEDNFVLK
jgi:hypothetical protein